jgi:hypothetical protein
MRESISKELVPAEGIDPPTFGLQRQEFVCRSNQHRGVRFAVVLLMPDDFGRSEMETGEKLRARQNVILELGYFIGRLGRDKVCALLKSNIAKN